MWAEMWKQIDEEIANYAQRIGRIATAPFRAIESIFELPKWVWGVGILSVLALLSFTLRPLFMSRYGK